MLGRGEIDVEAVQLLDSLRFDLLPSVLPDTNIRKFSVDWASPDGLDVFTHADYVKQFCETFYKSVQLVAALLYFVKLFGDFIQSCLRQCCLHN